MKRGLLLVIPLILGCSSPAADQVSTSTAPVGSSTTTSTPEAAPLIGFSLSPRDFGEEGFLAFFSTASLAGNAVAWAGPWDQLDGGATVVHRLASEYGDAPVVIIGLPSGPDGGRVLPEDPLRLISTVSAWVSAHPVDYLGFGVEVDSYLWERSPESFDTYAEIFAQLVGEVHRVSPGTVVFPGFQLERLRGLKGGLFGGEVGEPMWELIESFPTADAIGFSTYPGLIFPTPADIPGDYYTGLSELVGRPIVFTEVGWQAEGDLGAWSGTPDNQARFIGERLPELAAVGDLVVWSFLWDQPGAPGAFASMGLIDQAGAERPGRAAWQKVADGLLP